MIKEITTTLAKIHEHEPCKSGWVKLHKSLGGIKSYGLHTPIKFSQIAESNGLDDAVWCLRSICPEHEKEVRLFAADCAESVLHLYEKEHDDTRPRAAIQAARDFANGLIDDDPRAAAWYAARDAVWYAAGDAARDAARAACSAARAAAWYAARAADRAAARIAARDVRDAQVKMLIKRFG